MSLSRIGVARLLVQLFASWTKPPRALPGFREAGVGIDPRSWNRRPAGACVVEPSENVGRILNNRIPRVCHTIGAIFWALSEPVSPRGGSPVRDPERFVRGWFARALFRKERWHPLPQLTARITKAVGNLWSRAWLTEMRTRLRASTTAQTGLFTAWLCGFWANLRPPKRSLWKCTFGTGGLPRVTTRSAAQYHHGW
jgi:hypothetical protein